MGNRAIIKPEGKSTGVYLHWNGGVDSVTAFLKYCELRGFRGFDDPYGLARFCQVVGNYFGGGLSIGIEENLNEERDSTIDNGLYVVKDWKIIRHINKPDFRDNYDIDEFVKEIDKCQPESEQLGDFLDAPETALEDIRVGDIVFIQAIRENWEKHEVVGIGEDRVVNGRNVLGVPYVNKWGNGHDNPNNYLREKTRVLRQY